MRTRVGLLGLVVAAAVAVLALTALPAGAATKLKFFSKSTSQTFTDAAGNPVNAGIAAGDVFTGTDLNYVGNHKRHAKRYTSTDHLVCTFTSATAALCNGQIAIGSSMLLAENVTVNFTSDTIVVPINGGTGRFQHAKGSVASTSIGNTNNSDIVITLHG